MTFHDEKIHCVGKLESDRDREIDPSAQLQANLNLRKIYSLVYQRIFLTLPHMLFPHTLHFGIQPLLIPICFA